MRQSQTTPQRARILGADVDLVTREQVMSFVADAADGGRKAIVANHNLHSVHLLAKHPEMAVCYELADLIEIDSIPLIRWGRAMGLPVSPDHRCTYLDWRGDFWALAARRRWRVFYLGGTPGVASRAADLLMRRWPGVQIATRHGYFDHAPGSAENDEVVAQINGFQPHVLMVGMGMPIQEAWVGRNFAQLATGVVLPVGAAFDYEAGVQVAAPRVLGALGLEWLFRLALQPRRLFRRYLVEPWSLAGPALRDIDRYILGHSGPPPMSTRIVNTASTKPAHKKACAGPPFSA